jgi:hypothetical protein
MLFLWQVRESWTDMSTFLHFCCYPMLFLWQVREPVVKLLHLLRGLEFDASTGQPRLQELLLMDKIGEVSRLLS